MSARTRQPRSAVERLLTRANLPALGVGGPENRARLVGVLAAVAALHPGLPLADLLRPAVQAKPAAQPFSRHHRKRGFGVALHPATLDSARGRWRWTIASETVVSVP